MLRYMEKEVVIADSQHGFTKGKLCLINLVAFYNGVTVVVDKVRASDITCLDWCKALNTILHNIFVSCLFPWFYMFIYYFPPNSLAVILHHAPLFRVKLCPARGMQER